MSDTTKRITLQTTVEYRGRAFQISAEGYTLDELADMLDKRGLTPSSTTHSAPAAAAAPLCPTHGKPMKAMQRPDRQGRAWWCTCKMGDGYCQERA